MSNGSWHMRRGLRGTVWLREADLLSSRKLHRHMPSNRYVYWKTKQMALSVSDLTLHAQSQKNILPLHAQELQEWEL
jgi:hypothetical protein